MPVIKGDAGNPVIKLYKNERKKILEVTSLVTLMHRAKPMVADFGRAATGMVQVCEIFGIKETDDERDESGDGSRRRGGRDCENDSGIPEETGDSKTSAAGAD